MPGPGKEVVQIVALNVVQLIIFIHIVLSLGEAKEKTKMVRRPTTTSRRYVQRKEDQGESQEGF